MEQLILDGGIQPITADDVGTHRWVLLVLLGLIEGLNGTLYLLTGGSCLLLPPGMVEFVEAVQGLPPAFLLHQ